MKNPCLFYEGGKPCPRLNDDKNGPECLSCEKRMAYWQSLGALMDMGTMVQAEGNVGPATAPAERKEMMENQSGYGTKICRGPVCSALDPGGIERSPGAFGLCKKNKDGLLSFCRMCTAFEQHRYEATRTGKPCKSPTEYAETYKGRRDGRPGAAIPDKPGCRRQPPGKPLAEKPGPGDGLLDVVNERKNYSGIRISIDLERLDIDQVDEVLAMCRKLMR
ncbi:MAG: hypothetical protein AB1427_00810 [Thermodesulfobacteriota bacterium]